jgi:hypothetical protein
MKAKSYYYIIVGVFCLFLENQTLFGIKVQIPDSVMQILNDQAYKDWCNHITTQEIREGYKAYLCKTYGFNPEDMEEGELDEWMEEDSNEGIKIGPEYCVLARVRKYHEDNPEWCQKSKHDFFSGNGKCCSNNGVKFEDFENSSGETNIYWALYQGGLIFMQIEPEFAMFCFKHLLVLSHGQFPVFLFGPDPDPEINAIRRIQVALRMLSGHYFHQGYNTDTQALKNQACTLRKAIHEIVKY